ncbi:MAG: dockerin type I domain-containing protein, partial [Chloroflexota bacterium]
VDAASYTFVDNTDGTADFTWSGAPVGNYTATVMASDGNNSLVMKSFAIEVTAPTITTLNGTLNVQGRDDNSGNVTVSMYQNDAMVTETTVPVSASGEFTVPDVTPGTYDIYVKTAITLSSLQTIDMQPGANAVNFGEMLNGDANNTDKIDLVDFTILSVAFNATTGDDNFDARADFNGDGSINLVDFTLLSINFNEEGVKPTN